MTTEEEREVARIRQELRERLMSQKSEGVQEILACLRRFADRETGGINDLRSEYERWKLRFELLSLYCNN
jgi:hypothetical protein